MWIALGIPLGAVSFAAVSLGAPDVVLAQQPVQATERWANAPAVVSTAGSGTLKLCRDWMIRHSCREYGDISIPARIAVGDTFEITFGSNPKTIRFQVKGMMAEGRNCLLIPDYEEMPPNQPPNHPSDMVIVKECTVER